MWFNKLEVIWSISSDDPIRIVRQYNEISQTCSSTIRYWTWWTSLLNNIDRFRNKLIRSIHKLLKVFLGAIISDRCYCNFYYRHSSVVTHYTNLKNSASWSQSCQQIIHKNQMKHKRLLCNDTKNTNTCGNIIAIQINVIVFIIFYFSVHTVLRKSIGIGPENFFRKNSLERFSVRVPSLSSS